jgi:hypothetical protein
MTANMLTPRCPKCGDCKIILAPQTNPDHQTGYNLPVACTQCMWAGTLGDVPYVRL